VTIVDNKGNQGHARVLCVVKIKLDESEKLVEFHATGLRITKKHPLWFENQWQLPVDIANNYQNVATISDKKTNYVYNFILDHSHVLLVNNMKCVTFGHDIKEAFHPFYGTNAVIDVIKYLPGFENGIVNVNGNIRNLIGKNSIKEGERKEFHCIKI